jgi:hypothetical protein
MGDSNKVKESGTGKTEEYSKADSVSLVSLTRQTVTKKLFEK